jgi:hypothetical protein
MTLSADMITDLATFYNTDDFGKTGTLTVGAVVTYPTVIFSDPYQMISPASGEIATTAPQARGKASDFTAVVVNTSTLTVSGTVWKIIDKQAGEDALEVILILSKD